MTSEELYASLLPAWIAAHFGNEQMPLSYPPAEQDAVSTLFVALLENLSEPLPEEWNEWVTPRPHLNALQVHRGGLTRIFSRTRKERTGEVKPLHGNDVKVFYQEHLFYEKTTGFPDSALGKKWIAGDIDFDAELGPRLREAERGTFPALRYVPRGPVPFQGVLFNGYGSGDQEMWIGFRDPRDLPKPLDQLTPQERLEILRTKPGKRPILVPFPDVARLSWLQATPDELRQRFVNQADTFVIFTRKLIGAIAPDAAPVGGIDLLDDGTGFGMPGPVTFVYLPWMETLTVESVLQLLPEEPILREGTTIVVTNQPPDAVTLTLTDTTLDRQMSVCGITQILDRLSYQPAVWSEFLGNQYSIRLASGSDAPRLRHLIGRRDPGVLRTLPDLHAAIERNKLRPGTGIRLTGRHGAGKSTAMVQLILRDLAQALVAIVDAALLAPGDLAMLRGILNEVGTRVSGVALVCDDIDTLPDDLRDAFLRTAQMLRAQDDRVSVLITYNALHADAMTQTSTFVALQMPEELLDAAPSMFRDRLLHRYCRALNIPLNNHDFEELQRAVNRAGNTPRAVVDLTLDASQRLVAEALRAAAPTTTFWKDQYRVLDARKEAAADLLQILGFLKFGDMLTPGEPLVEHFFRGYFARSSADWRAGLDALSSAGIMTVSNGRIFSDVPVFAELPELRSETATHFRGLVDWLLDGDHGLPIWGTVVSKFAEAFLQHQQWDEALCAAAALMAELPDEYAGYMYNARALAAKGENEQALAFVKKSTQDHPEWISLWFALAIVLLGTGTRDQFYQAMDEYLESEYLPSRRRGSTGGKRVSVNVIYHKLEDVEGVAERVFRQLPEDPAFLLQLYGIALHEKQYAKSMSYVERTIASWWSMGWPLAGLIQKAMRPLYDLCKGTPAAAFIFADAATAVLSDTPTALEASDFIQCLGDGCAAHAVRGVAHNRTRDYASAIVEFTAVLALHPQLNQTFTWIHSRLLDAMTKAPDCRPSTAIELVRNIASLAAMEKEDRFRYALNLLYNGEFDDADEQFRLIGEWPAHEIELKRGVGFVRLHQARYAEAIELETQVLEQWPFDVAALTIRSNAHRSLGNLTAAEEDLCGAMQLDDADQMLDEIVINLVRIGKARDAITFLFDLRRTTSTSRMTPSGAELLRKELPSLPRAQRLALERLVA